MSNQGADINAEDKPIMDLFDDKYLFEIPAFQRPFSWEEENFEDLVDDISYEMESNATADDLDEYSAYFLGSIILRIQDERSDGSGEYEIIDGQQRMISVTILMAVIRDMIEDKKASDKLQSCIYQEEDEYTGTEESVRVKVRDSEKELFRKYILKEGGTSDVDELDDTDLSESKQRIVNAIDVFDDRFRDDDQIPDQEFLKTFTKYLLQKVVFVEIKTESLSSAFRFFNIINARGLPLTNADLLKSVNLGEITDDGRRERYAREWEQIEQDIGAEEMESLISFLRHIKVKEKARQSIYDEFDEKVFRQEPSFKGKEFIETIVDISKIYQDKIVDGNIDTNDGRKDTYYYNLVSLMRNFFPTEDWMAAVIRFKKKFGQDEDLHNFVRQLEKKITVDWISGLTSTERLTQIYDVIRLIESADSVDAILSSKMFDEELSELRNDFEDTLQLDNFYRKGNYQMAKYVLLRLDLERYDNTNRRVSYEGQVSVEHILPRNPDHDYWLTRFDEAERLQWVNRFGNLVLLNKRKNSRASNKPYPKKVSEYFEKRSDFAITNELSEEYDDWNPTNTQNRHKDLQKAATDIWFNGTASKQ